jgi:hypothetical protein
VHAAASAGTLGPTILFFTQYEPLLNHGSSLNCALLWVTPLNITEKRGVPQLMDKCATNEEICTAIDFLRLVMKPFHGS